MLGILYGRVYDPANRCDGVVRDIWVDGGGIVAAPKTAEGRSEAETIDASGLVVMAGGVDIHSHIAGSKINAGRKFRPEDHRDHVRARTAVTRSCVGYTTSTAPMIGLLYAEIGYTTVMEAATTIPVRRPMKTSFVHAIRCVPSRANSRLGTGRCAFATCVPLLMMVNTCAAGLS